MKLAGPLAQGSLGVRISLLITLNSSLALLLAGVALFGYENLQQRKTAVREMSAQAAIVGGSSTAALSFADGRAAAATLSALRGDSRVFEAIIFDHNNRVFARYLSNGSATSGPGPQWRDPGVYFEDGAVLVFQPITLGGEQLGTIFLKSSNDVGGRLRRYVGIVLVVFLFSLALARLLSSRMLRALTGPITALAAVARSVSRDRNYGVRAIRDGGREIGILIDSFNDMLAQIESHELARKAAEELLRESEERYAIAARGANDGLWDWKLATGEIYFSSRWNQMLGRPAADRWSGPEEWFDLVHPSDRDRVRAEIAAHRQGTTSEFSSEYRLRHQNGSYIWVLTRGIAVRDPDGAAVRMAGSQTDITEGKVADPLTGLPNRLYFVDKIECSIETAARVGSSFAVLFLDLDRFKLVNDSLGHAAGDELLAGVASRLRSGVREGWPAGQSVVARHGGDEFAVLLNDVQNPEDVAAVAQRILKQFENPFRLDGRKVFATVSVGIAMNGSGNTPEDLLRNADTAMYYAKAAGKARFELFDEGMRERAIARLEIETGLRKAIDDRQLLLYYQPELSLHNRKVKGYEALIRWNRPDRGILSPAEFIPVAEESDLIIHLGRWVLQEACRQMAEWHRRFFFNPPLTISVNVSPKQLISSGFVEDVQRVLAETGLEPTCLKLEVTESSIMGDPEAALGALRRLKLMKVGLEIDDFGTGYSSLSYLRKLPFDTVKIDRSFINEMGAGDENSEIVRTILDLARSLEMEVVAEGVETGDQVRKLTALDCDYVQGFFFARPAAAHSTQAHMEQRSNLHRDLETLQRSGDALAMLDTIAV